MVSNKPWNNCSKCGKPCWCKKVAGTCRTCSKKNSGKYVSAGRWSRRLKKRRDGIKR